MARTKLKWSSLLRLTELDFRPDFPTELSVLDEVSAVISWLTGCTNQDRRLLRCTPQGALLIGNAWDLLSFVESFEKYPGPDDPQEAYATKDNIGVLISTSTQLVRIRIKRTILSLYEDIYLAANTMYFFPYSTFMVFIAAVPEATGTASYVGITFYK